MQQTLIDRVHDYIREQDLLTSHMSVLIGVSGGADSVLLLNALAQLRDTLPISLYAAHLDHEWRPESHEDLEFCKQLAHSMNVPLFHERASNISINAPRGSWEARARLIRRSFFEHIQARYNIDRIALAHHQDDQRETFFIRLLRGTGLTGLASIQPRRGSYIHPLLGVSKDEIIQYLHDHGISYITDSTNVSDAMLRNRVRKHLIPALKTCDDRALTSLDRTIAHLQDANDYLQEHVAYTYPTFTEIHNGVTWLNVGKVQRTHAYLRRQIILHWLIEHEAQFTPTAGLFQEIERFFNNTKSKRHRIHPRWGIYQDKDYARIYQIEQP